MCIGCSSVCWSKHSLVLQVATILAVFSRGHADLEDTSAWCPEWAASGECTRNDEFMAKACPKSCSGSTDISREVRGSEIAREEDARQREQDDTKRHLEECQQKLDIARQDVVTSEQRCDMRVRTASEASSDDATAICNRCSQSAEERALARSPGTAHCHQLLHESREQASVYREQLDTEKSLTNERLQQERDKTTTLVRMEMEVQCGRAKKELELACGRQMTKVEEAVKEREADLRQKVKTEYLKAASARRELQQVQGEMQKLATEQAGKMVGEANDRSKRLAKEAGFAEQARQRMEKEYRQQEIRHSTAIASMQQALDVERARVRQLEQQAAAWEVRAAHAEERFGACLADAVFDAGMCGVNTTYPE